MNKRELNPPSEDTMKSHDSESLADTGAESPTEQRARFTRWESLLPRFSLNRRITVLVLLASALVIGAVATVGIPLEMFPAGFTEPFMAVQAPWRDAPAPEVLDKVVLPLEEQLSTVRGLDRLTAVATTGQGSIYMRFKQGTDMDVAYREVRDRVERARARLPDDADKVFIRKFDTSGFPIAVVGVAIDPKLANSYDLVQNEVVLRLQRIDGVANVEVNGLEEKEILIELDRQRTEASGLNIYELGQQLGGDNFSLARSCCCARWPATPTSMRCARGRWPPMCGWATSPPSSMRSRRRTTASGSTRCRRWRSKYKRRAMPTRWRSAGRCAPRSSACARTRASAIPISQC
jgi:hypothetical protein